MYGTQARLVEEHNRQKFENDVKMYGTQAFPIYTCSTTRFENDVMV